MSDTAQLSTHADLLKTFKHQLLRYKSLVYEQYVTPLAQHDYQVTEAKIGKPAILVIEDNVDEWLLIRHTLVQQFPDVELVWAATPLEVTLYFKRCSGEERSLPYFILVDLYLPTAKLGLALIRTLKAHRLFQAIPFITISRSAQADDISQAFMHSSDGYIVKPATYTDWPAAFSSLNDYIPVTHS